MPKSNALGAWAEQRALRLLTAQGFEIVAHNYHSRYGEIDLIAAQDQLLVFVEVKARSSTEWGNAYDVVTRAKQHKIIKTALCFIMHKPEFEQKFLRFDVIGFDFYYKFAKNVQYDFGKYTYDLQWIENAFTLDTDLINL